MISAFSSPILVTTEKTEHLLKRVALSGTDSTEAYSEEWLQNLLYRHPAALPVEDIDNSFSGMVPVCREMATPAGPIDVVYITKEGRPVIVEAKLWRNPESRRKVIGQILDYAKELSAWDFATFDAAVRQARRAEDGAAPRGLLELAGIETGTQEAARFHDSLTRSLRRGDLLLLIVGDGIREGVGAITNFLDRNGSLHFTFGLVEMAIFRMPDGGQLVQPRILAQSTIIKRIVVDLRDASLQASESNGETEEEDAPDGPSIEVLEARKRFEEFWMGFLRKLQLDDKSQEIGPPARAQNQYFKMPSESQAWVSAYLAASKNRAGVYLTFNKGPIGDRIFKSLEGDKAAIERAIGVPVEWVTDGEKHMVISAKAFSGALIEDHGEAVQRVLADWTNRYVNVFRPRLERLVREGA